MEDQTLAVEAEVEETHWWFTCRRRLFARIIRAQNLPNDSVILDVGTGTGANLRMLRSLGFQDITGVDASETAIFFCAQKHLGKVHQGDICNLPVPDESIHLVTATDIVEHVDDDSLALSEVRRVLRPGGLALLTVPTFQSLWGPQDDLSFHKRRYRLREFRHLLIQADLEILESYYFNYLLFLPIFVARQIIKALGIQLASENEVNSPPINRLLTWIFELDCLTAGKLRPPFGVSALAVVRRPIERA